MPVVLVEIAPPNPPAVLARVLLDACSASVREGRCDLATDQPAAKSVAVAIVQWDEPGERRVRIQVGVRRDHEPEWRARSLDFRDTDARAERWRSVGLTIATLAGELVPEPDASDTTPPAAGGKAGAASAPAGVGATAGASQGAAAGTPSKAGATSPTPERPSDSSGRAAGTDEEPRDGEPPGGAGADRERGDHAPRKGASGPPPSLWAGVSVTTGPGLGDGAWRFGGAVDVGWRPTSVPLFARATFGFAARPDNGDRLSVQWQTATLGGGVVIGGRAVALEPRVAVGLEGLRVSAKDSASLRQDSGSHWQPTVCGGADLVWLISRLGVVATVEAWRGPAATQILLEGRPVATGLAGSWALGLGARVVLE